VRAFGHRCAEGNSGGKRARRRGRTRRRVRIIGAPGVCRQYAQNRRCRWDYTT
jgi:hypothetical protein